MSFSQVLRVTCLQTYRSQPTNTLLKANIKLGETSSLSYPCRRLSMTLFCHKEKLDDQAKDDEVKVPGIKHMSGSFKSPAMSVLERNPKDRRRKIPLEISLKYMDSAAYRETYGDAKVWELYRRNTPNCKARPKTRRSCVVDGFINNASPCPICRDEYLVVDYRNIKLLAQFLKDYNGEILTSFDTGVCQEQWLNIRVALEKAKDHGYLDLTPPFVEYDYEKYMVH